MGIPQVATCALAAGPAGDPALACRRPGSGRLRVASLLEALLDGQLRAGFKPSGDGLDPLLLAWQKALGRGEGQIQLDEEDLERLSIATHHWREAVAGRVAPARACLELFTPAEGEELWELSFSLQAEADPSLRVPAAVAWSSGDRTLQLGEVAVPQPSELLLEGLGRALTVFEPIERGLDATTPETMQLTPAEAFVLVRTAAAQLRDVGVGVVLPESLSGGLASRLGLAITAELPETSRGFTLGESLVWHWEFMIGGVTLNLRDLERLSAKRSPLVQHKGVWIELRPSRPAQRRALQRRRLGPQPRRRPAAHRQRRRHLPPAAGARLQRRSAAAGGAGAIPPAEGPRSPAGAPRLLRPAAALPGAGSGLAGLPAPLRPGGLPGRRHGPGQNDPAAGLPAAPQSRRRTQGAGAAGGPHLGAHQLEAGGGGLHTRAGGEGALRPAPAQQRSGAQKGPQGGGSGAHQLRPAAARQRTAGAHRLAGGGDRRGPGDQKPQRQAVDGRP
jgi:hypothetical protein